MPRNLIQFFLSVFICALLTALNFTHCQSAITNYGREITNKLCSPEMEGRGYVNSGCEKAASFIVSEFNNLGLLPMNGVSKQPFTFSVNTFPNKCSIRLRFRKQIPGINFLVHPSCAPHHGRLSLIPMGSNEVLSYSYGKLPQGKAIAFVPHPGIPRDSLRIIRNKLEKIAQVDVPVIEYTREKLTWSVSSSQFKYPYIQIFDTLDVSVPKQIKINIDAKFEKQVSVDNIMGYVPAKNSSDSFIVVCAHYDHLGRMGKKTYFPGGNDNASGVAMMLTLAKAIKNQPLPNHNVLFIAFAGEEIGLKGSTFFVNESGGLLNQISMVLNLDIMGSGEEGITVVNGSVYTALFDKLKQINNSTLSVSTIKTRGRAANSDHYPFSEKGVPSLFIYTMGPNKNYHDIFDKSEALSFNRFDELSYLLLRFLQTF